MVGAEQRRTCDRAARFSDKERLRRTVLTGACVCSKGQACLLIPIGPHLRSLVCSLPSPCAIMPVGCQWAGLLSADSTLCAVLVLCWAKLVRRHPAAMCIHQQLAAPDSRVCWGGGGGGGCWVPVHGMYSCAGCSSLFRLTSARQGT